MTYPSIKEWSFTPPLAEWFLINWKIETSVTSNNLTVSLKTLAWTDPSPTNPVYCRIWNTIRTITSTLSTTFNAWTNWFNAGSSELATQEIDYFVYLWWTTVYNTVYIMPSRIPYARTKTDFSTTNTNERFAPNASDMNQTDEVVVVWRFNAILSATASFNRSIPATSIIINRPIFETRILNRVPTKTNSWTMGVANGWANTIFYKYQIKWNMCYVNGSEVQTLTAPATHSIYYTAPIDCFRHWFAEDVKYVGAAQFWNGDLATCLMNARIWWNSSKIDYRMIGSVNSWNFYLWNFRNSWSITYPIWDSL